MVVHRSPQPALEETPGVIQRGDVPAPADDGAFEDASLSNGPEGSLSSEPQKKKGGGVTSIDELQRSLPDLEERALLCVRTATNWRDAILATLPLGSIRKPGDGRIADTFYSVQLHRGSIIFNLPESRAAPLLEYLGVRLILGRGRSGHLDEPLFPSLAPNRETKAPEQRFLSPRPLSANEDGELPAQRPPFRKMRPWNELSGVSISLVMPVEPKELEAAFCAQLEHMQRKIRSISRSQEVPHLDCTPELLGGVPFSGGDSTVLGLRRRIGLELWEKILEGLGLPEGDGPFGRVAELYNQIGSEDAEAATIFGWWQIGGLSLQEIGVMLSRPLHGWVSPRAKYLRDLVKRLRQSETLATAGIESDFAGESSPGSCS